MKALRNWATARERAFAAELASAEQAAQNEFDELLRRLPTESHGDILETLQKRRSNLHIQPEFTPIVVGTCQQILVFGGAGLALFATVLDDIRVLGRGWLVALTILTLLYLNLIILSFVTLTWFFIQSRCRYPFLFLRRFGNTIPYFYYETVSREQTWTPIRSFRGIVSFNKKYLSDFGRYAENVVTETTTTQIEVELKQTYLLIVYQGFLDQFEMQLAHIFLVGLLGSLLAVITLLWLGAV